MKSMKMIFGLILVALLYTTAMASPLKLTVVRDGTDDSRVIFRWKGDGSQVYKLYYDSALPVDLGGSNFIPIDITVANYSACSPAVTPTSGLDYDYTYCYDFPVNIEYFVMTSLNEGGCVVGTITDINGLPLPGAAVCISRTVGGDTCVFTNGVGQYSACGFDAGSHDINVSVACEAPQAGTVMISATDAAVYDYQLTTIPIVRHSGHITANETWSSAQIHQLFGQVIVDPGVVLTIDPGTRIIGSYPNVGVLILAAGGTDCSDGGGIYAVGTPTNPIVFTSNRPCGLRSNGDWGGIVINGRAHNNRGIVPNGEGDSGPFGLGGPNAPDYSCDAAPNGSEITMRYCRLEFPGFRYTPTNELNGLCLQSVSAGADISYIQVQRGQDDCIEWFGGTASVHHMVLGEAGDDHFDWTDGPQMAASHVVIHARVADADRGIEADNYEFGMDFNPRAHAYMSNFTIIGGEGTGSVGEYGATLRRGTEFDIDNFIVQACKKGAIDMDDAATSLNANGGLPFGQWYPARTSIDYSLFWDNGTAASEGIDPTTPAGIGDGHFYYENSEWTNQASFPVNTYHIAAPVGWSQNTGDWRGSGDGSVGTNATNNCVDPMLVNPLGAIVPSGFGYDVFTYDARPVAGSPALTGAAPSLPAPPFLPPWWPLPTPTYRGAFSGPTDSWAETWTSYPVN